MNRTVWPRTGWTQRHGRPLCYVKCVNGLSRARWSFGLKQACLLTSVDTSVCAIAPYQPDLTRTTGKARQWALDALEDCVSVFKEQKVTQLIGLFRTKAGDFRAELVRTLKGKATFQDHERMAWSAGYTGHEAARQVAKMLRMHEGGSVMDEKFVIAVAMLRKTVYDECVTKRHKTFDWARFYEFAPKLTDPDFMNTPLAANVRKEDMETNGRWDLNDLGIA